MDRLLSPWPFRNSSINSLHFGSNCGFFPLEVFWYDEVCTLVLSRLHWKTLWHTPDGIPPVFYLLESASRRIFSSDQIALRAPSIFGLCLTVLCLFFWLKRRFTPIVAFAATLLPLLTVCYSFFAAEARPYSLLVALFAFALVCYDRAPAIPWMILLALSLALAETVHYYAVIIAVPFLGAEAFFVLKQRSFRWPVWCALSAVAVPLLVLWPLLVNFRAVFGEHFWAQPTFRTVLGIYGWLFDQPLKQNLLSPSAAFPLALFALAVCLIVFLIARGLRTDAWSQRASDDILIAMFLGSPVVFFFLSLITHGGLTERYLLPTIFGMAPVLAMGLEKLSRRTRVFVCGLILFAFLTRETAFWLFYYESYLLHFPRPTSIESMIAAAKHPDLPVIISNAHDYLPLTIYAGPEWNRRFFFISDAEGAVRYGEWDTDDKELVMFRNFTPLHVFTYSEFKLHHSQLFLLYSNPFQGRRVNGSDWWVLRLKAEGYSLEKLQSDGFHTVYLVKQPEDIAERN